jgi:hypothetical protein
VLPSGLFTGLRAHSTLDFLELFVTATSVNEKVMLRSTRWLVQLKHLPSYSTTKGKT